MCTTFSAAGSLGAFANIADFDDNKSTARRNSARRIDIIRALANVWQLYQGGANRRIAGKTILIAMQSGCIYCTESMPFYQRLFEERERTGASIQIVALASERDVAIRGYLDGFELNPDKVVFTQWGETLKIRGTPTVFLTDSTGTVTHVWAGQIPSLIHSEDKVMEVIFGNRNDIG